jgi:hypothetical protein
VYVALGVRQGRFFLKEGCNGNASIFRKKRPEGEACPISFPGGIEETFLEHQPVTEPRTVHSFLSRLNRRKSLFDALAATLDQDDQHNHGKDGGSYANKCYIVHVNSPFLLSKIFVETLHYGDSRGTECHQKQGGKDKQDKREDKFDRCLRCLLLHFLATLGSQGVRMNS